MDRPQRHPYIPLLRSVTVNQDNKEVIICHSGRRNYLIRIVFCKILDIFLR